MASPLQLVPTQPISAAEAQARLVALGDRPINATHLALEWGWSRSKVRRLVARCRAQGIIRPVAAGAGVAGRKRRAPAAKIRVPTRETPAAATPRGTAMEVTSETLTPDDIAAPEALEAETYDRDVSLRRARRNPPPTPPSFGIRFVALILGLTAIALGAVGFMLNVAFAQNYGAPGSIVASIMSVLFGLIDILTIILPTVAGHLWNEKQRHPAALAWAVWAGTLTMTLIAASSFTATNIGDTNQKRANVTAERIALEDELARLRSDRASITETRSAASIEAAIQQEQPRVPTANWKASKGCTSVTLSGNQCHTINTQRQAKADAERRDVLDAEIGKAETAFAQLPAYVAADPGADMAAKLFTLATLGAVSVPSQAIQQIRIFGLTLAPATSGLLLLFAGLTWRRRDSDAPPPLL